MAPERELGQLLALTQLGATATRPEELIEASLPRLLEIVAATSALVVARSADGPVVSALAGQ